jgi:NAD-dependent SIR2 family protein deacetylase
MLGGTIMAFSLDDKPLIFTCPKCGNKIEKTIGWFKADHPSCSFCWTRFENEEFRREVEEAEKLIGNTLRKLRAIKIDI